MTVSARTRGSLPSPPAPPAVQRFRVFAFLWCSAVLLHQLYQGRLLVLDATAPLSFVALFALLRPGAIGRFALLLAVQLATVLWELPRVSNHWLLMAITGAGLLIVLLPARWGRHRGEDPAATCEAALGPVRVQLIVLYGFATFHKLNTGFFDPELSCAVAHYTRLAGSLGFLPTGAWTRMPAIVGTLAIEAGLPLLLAFRATRWIALPCGWGFHLMLGWNGFWDFASAGSAYYAAFLPLWALEGFARARARHAWLDAIAAGTGRLAASPWTLPVATAALAASLGASALRGADGAETILAVNRVGRIVWLVLWLLLGGALGLSLLAGRVQRGRTPEPAIAWWRRPALWLAPVLVFANGLSPYLGLKSEHSFAMFSNLRTEGGTWNHTLVPSGVRVFGYAGTVIRLEDSSDPYLRNLARHGFGMVPTALRRYLAERPDVALSYWRDGRLVRARRAADDPFLSRPLHPLERKLILFRPVPPPGGNACLH